MLGTCMLPVSLAVGLSCSFAKALENKNKQERIPLATTAESWDMF